MSTADSTSETKTPAPASTPSPLPENCLDAKIRTSLNLLLFGNSANDLDVERWNNQGFVFSDDAKIRWGLTQSYGGPCGILAPMQCFVLTDLLFSENKLECDGKTIPTPTNEQRANALVRSLTSVLTRAKPSAESPYVLVDCTGSSVTSATAEEITSINVTTEADVIAFFHAHMALLTSPVGVVTFVYSLLLTRGLQTVKDDMDDLEQPMVARFGHCTQELVNLVMCGVAATNVFDGDKDMGGLILKGIPRQNEVGYITLMECLRLTKVGEHYKSPLNPVWVVGSSTHYTVLFSLDSRVGKQSEEKKVTNSVVAAFNSLDPEENGFLQADRLDALLAALGYTGSVPAARSALVSDWGMILRDTVIQLAPGLLGHGSRGNSGSGSYPEGPWSCAACTFTNTQASARACEICTTPRPPPPTTPSANDPNAAPNNFSAFHFNGISNHRGSVPTLSNLQVTLLGEGVQSSGQSNSRGLREVMMTRWPAALVEYENDVAPKII
jgi:hypothetical protein